MTRTKSVYLASVAVMLSPTAAYADIIYTLRGFTATDISEVTGILTLADSYTPGTELASADFISFAFSSKVQNYTVPGSFDFGAVLDIALPVFHGYAITSGRAPGESGFDFAGPNTYLWLYGEGLWESADGDQQAATFFGFHAEWTRQIPRQVSEPGSLALLAIGLFGTGLSRRKKI